MVPIRHAVPTAAAAAADRKIHSRWAGMAPMVMRCLEAECLLCIRLGESHYCQRKKFTTNLPVCRDDSLVLFFLPSPKWLLDQESLFTKNFIWQKRQKSIEYTVFLLLKKKKQMFTARRACLVLCCRKKFDSYTCVHVSACVLG